jgi:maltooligosyltrehalose trehalohydrolase
MTEFAVWGPEPGSVELQLDGRRLPMTRDERGWWRVDADAAPGADYGFIVNGQEPPLPDPRSAWQPAGVHGLSRLVDHGDFAWTDAGFRAPPLAASVIYELHIGTFSPAGTFDGAIERLDHLVDLGVTHVEVLPVNEFPGERGWGYDGVDLFAPHHAYGGPDGLKRLVDACHARGLAVLLDVVYNHLGPAGNYLGKFGPYFTETHTSPWGPAVNFDAADSDEVRRFFCDNALMWLREYHFDGLRLDAIHAIVDTSARHILEQIAVEVDDLESVTGRPLVLIAESDLNDPRVVRPTELGGYGMDAQWSDDFHHALHSVLTGERTGYYSDFGQVEHLAAALRRGFVYVGQHSRHRRRMHGRAPLGVPGWRLLGYLQNHDQVGNRARGDRIGHLTTPERARVGAAIVLTAPFVPLLFQGEEWAASAPFAFFTDHDPELGEAVRTGRQREFAAFGWKPSEVPDPQDPATFERSRLDWDERDRGEHAATLDWYRRLIALRRSTPELGGGRLERVRVESDEARCTLVVRRGSIGTVVNLGHEVAQFDLAVAEVLLASEPGIQVRADAIGVPADAVAIVRLAPDVERDEP